MEWTQLSSLLWWRDEKYKRATGPNLLGSSSQWHNARPFILLHMKWIYASSGDCSSRFPGIIQPRLVVDRTRRLLYSRWSDDRILFRCWWWYDQDRSKPDRMCCYGYQVHLFSDGQRLLESKHRHSSQWHLPSASLSVKQEKGWAIFKHQFMTCRPVQETDLVHRSTPPLWSTGCFIIHAVVLRAFGGRGISLSLGNVLSEWHKVVFEFATQQKKCLWLRPPTWSFVRSSFSPEAWALVKWLVPFVSFIRLGERYLKEGKKPLPSIIAVESEVIKMFFHIKRAVAKFDWLSSNVSKPWGTLTRDLLLAVLGVVASTRPVYLGAHLYRWYSVSDLILSVTSPRALLE